MGRVIGIGGVFFKAKDPKALSEWYRDHLGFALNNWANSSHNRMKRGYVGIGPFTCVNPKVALTALLEYLFRERVPDFGVVMEHFKVGVLQ